MTAILEAEVTEPLIDVSEVMRRYSLSRSAVINAIHRGDLPGHRFGNAWAVSPRHAEMLWAKRVYRRERQQKVSV